MGNLGSVFSTQIRILKRSNGRRFLHLLCILTEWHSSATRSTCSLIQSFLSTESRQQVEIDGRLHSNLFLLYQCSSVFISG